MASYLRTPSSPATFKHDTPAYLEAGTAAEQKYAKFGRQKEFEACRKLERIAVSKHVDKFIKSNGKGRLMAAEDRFALLWKEREVKVTERLRQDKSTMENNFPELYQEHTEKAWLHNEFKTILCGDGGRGYQDRHQDQDQDDEEPPIPIKAEPSAEDADETTGGEEIRAKHRAGHKSEIATYLYSGDSSQHSLLGASSKQSGSRKTRFRKKPQKNYRESSDEEDDEEDEDEERKPTGRAVAVACSRSSALQSGCGELPGRKRGQKTEVVAFVGTSRMPSTTSKRSWQWIDGKMVVWPRWDANIDTRNAVADESKKRKAEEKLIEPTVVKKGKL